MPSVWSCSPCAVLLLSAVVGREAGATHVGGRHKALAHRVEKVQAQVTAHPKKRDATVCPSSYDLCPASLNGGCCPPRYGCATDACYATTAGTQSACNMAGYYNCGAAAGGGCCPEGYICGADDCTAPAGVSSVMTSCPASYYLCPASFNYGCCLTGYGCATNACYVTTLSTATYTQTATTTDAGGQTITTTRTATTVQTPTPPTAVPLTSNSNAVAKFIPTSVEKVPATSSPSSGGGGGLTKPQLGGIIGGAVALLLAVVVAAFIVIRRLNRVANVVGTPKTSSSGDQSGSNHRPAAMAQQYRPSPSEIDGMGYDPLMMPNTPGDGGSSIGAAGTPQGWPNGGGRNRSDSDYSSQPAITPYGAPDTAARHPSMDSNPAGAGYFDILRVHNMPGARPATTMRASVDSQGNVVQYGHGRQWSNTSELSNGSSDTAHGVGSPLIPAELDVAGGFIPELDVSPADGGGGRRPRSGTSSSSAVGSPRPSLNNRRYSSSGSGAAGAGLPSPTGNQPLDPVNESAEVMHGHYGPRRGQVGQTAAGLEIQHDITSPVAVRFQERG